MAQETQTGSLYQPRGVGWGGRCEGGSNGRGYMYTYGLFMLRFDRKQQNSVRQFSSVQSLNSVQHFVTPMDCSTPGFPVHHQLLEFIQTHVHRVGDAIQPSHPLSSSSCQQSFPASVSFPVSHFFASGGQSIEVSASASVLPVNIQD